MTDLPAKKPPLGLLRRRHWDEQRLVALLEAMIRYVQAGDSLPPDWTDELNELLTNREQLERARGTTGG